MQNSLLKNIMRGVIHSTIDERPGITLMQLWGELEECDPERILSFPELLDLINAMQEDGDIEKVTKLYSKE